MKKVFISYESSNEKQALDLVTALENRKLSCWIAKKDVPKGEPYDDYIPKAIAECSVVVMLFSEASMSSPHVKNELRLAVKRDKKVIPFMLEDIELREAFEYHIESNNRISADQSWDEAVEELVCSLYRANLLPKPEHKETETTIPAILRETDVKCPLCHSGEYTPRYDNLEKLVFTEEGQCYAHRQGNKSIILCIVCTVYFLLHLFTKSSTGIIFRGIAFDEVFVFFVISLLWGLGSAFYFLKFGWIYEQRRRRRVRKHIAVYHLTCNSCIHKFKTVIDLDRRSIVKHTHIKRSNVLPSLIARTNLSQVILLICVVVFCILLVTGKMTININNLYKQIVSIIR